MQVDSGRAGRDLCQVYGYGYAVLYKHVIIEKDMKQCVQL